MNGCCSVLLACHDACFMPLPAGIYMSTHICNNVSIGCLLTALCARCALREALWKVSPAK